jgi:gamma-glutamylcyclotransferase
MIKYFTYGSNMSISRIIKRGISPSTGNVGILKGWELKFNKKASAGDWSFANIMENKESSVEGIVFGITEEELKLLDKFEGAPKHYRREKVNVLSRGELVECITYIAQEEHIKEGLFPTEEYLGFLIDGASRLSPEYQKMILEISKIG